MKNTSRNSAFSAPKVFESCENYNLKVAEILGIKNPRKYLESIVKRNPIWLEYYNKKHDKKLKLACN